MVVSLLLIEIIQLMLHFSLVAMGERDPGSERDHRNLRYKLRSSRANLKIEKGKLVEQAYDECDALIL